MIDPKVCLENALLHYFEQPENRNMTYYDVTVTMFPQAFSDTTLGFGGIGGQAITTSYVVVINDYEYAYVYFGGRLAYKVKGPLQDFYDDVRNQCMRPRYESIKYSNKDRKETK